MFLNKKWTVGLAILASLAALSSCNKVQPEPKPEPEPEPEPVVQTAGLSLVSVTQSTAEFLVETEGFECSSYAYVVYEAAAAPEAAPAAAVIYRDGTVGDVVDGSASFTVSSLMGQTTYKIYVALTAGEEYYSDILSSDFTTSEYTEDLALAQAHYDGFTMYVNVPESVKEAGNAVRYGGKCLPFYNYYKQYWGNVDADDLANDGGLGFYLTEPGYVTWTDEDNVYEDEYGDSYYKHFPITPGEPFVFFVGEFAWAEDEYRGDGYHTALFDFESFYNYYYENWTMPEDEYAYWTGHHGKIEFETLPPVEMDATVKVEAEMGAMTGTLKLTPDKGVLQYGLLVCDDETYRMVVEILDGNEDYMQWFVTSYFGYMSFGITYLPGSEPYEINLADVLYLQPETEYHVLITAIGDEQMINQSFVHTTVATTAKSLPAPEVTVTALDSDDPFEVRFNVKNTGDVEITSAKYAADYIRNFDGSLNRGYDYNTLLTYYGNAFSAEDIAAINTAEGLDVRFSSLDGMTTRLAVQVANIEETYNDLTAEDCPAIAEATTIEQPAAERVESALFDELPGDWTFTALAQYPVYNYETFTNDYYDTTIVKKAVIYNGINDYPETLPEDVYELYLGISNPETGSNYTRDEVTALYDEFKMEAEAYNAKVRGQNRMVVLGFGAENANNYYKAYTPYTPYELFCKEDYNGYDVASLFFDYGPKWYLQVAADGSVSAPISYETMVPMANNNGYYSYYLAAMNLAAGAGEYEGAFGVTVADGNSTLTVEPMTLEDGTVLYPNGIYVNYGYAYLAGYEIKSAVTLTKGYTAPAAAASVRGKSGSEKTPEYRLAPIPSVAKPAYVHKSRSSFIGTIPEYKQMSLTPATIDVVKAKLDENRPESSHRR